MLSLLVAVVLTFSDAPSVDDKPLAEWRARIAPAESERAWSSIGWRANFWAAVEEANAAEKPILLWAMNGHPLGCT
ncbi:MAG: hypothetical protein HZA52_00280 [Planctomycetes bacterium]|nr:hypothetical protein [Planctomycetota bacterium]